MMIRTRADDNTNETYHILISTVDNEITRAATRYRRKQVEFFKYILQAIVQEPLGAITWPQVMKCAAKAMLPSAPKEYSTAKQECTALIQEWTAKKWFLQLKDTCVTLGVRSMAELDVFIKEKLIAEPQDLDCKNCGSMAILSVLCSSCGVRFHKRCATISIDAQTGRCRHCRPSE